MTKIITSDNIFDAAECIANGGLVVFPTETVYGLGADSIAKIVDQIQSRFIALYF